MDSILFFYRVTCNQIRFFSPFFSRTGDGNTSNFLSSGDRDRDKFYYQPCLKEHDNAKQSMKRYSKCCTGLRFYPHKFVHIRYVFCINFYPVVLGIKILIVYAQNVLDSSTEESENSENPRYPVSHNPIALEARQRWRRRRDSRDLVDGGSDGWRPPAMAAAPPLP